MKIILLDTNFLLVPFRFKIDIFSEFERIIDEKIDLIVLDVCLNELKKITKEIEFNSIIEMLKRKNVKVIELEKGGKKDIDKIIIEFAKEKNCVIATNDKSLRKMAKKNGLNTIFLRKKKFLEIE
jgi:rRNA-processing protein FCF1